MVFETAEACKVSVQRDDPNFLISGDNFSCVRKTFCAQGRHTASLLYPVGNTDVRAIFWSSLDMTAFFDRVEICSFAGMSCANFLFSKKVDFSDMSKFPHFPLPAAEMKYAQG